MNEIRLKEVCGAEVRSRVHAKKLYGLVDSTTASVDMNGVVFISRSVADELCNLSDAFPALQFINMAEDVELMLTIVRKGRSARRVLKPRFHKSVTINCTNMDDLREALVSH